MNDLRLNYVSIQWLFSNFNLKTLIVLSKNYHGLDHMHPFFKIYIDSRKCLYKKSEGTYTAGFSDRLSNVVAFDITNYGAFQLRIASLLLQKDYGLRPQPIVVACIHKWPLSDFNLATHMSNLTT